MSRNIKTVENSKWHMTKAEKDLRLAAEKAAFTGIKMHEFKATKEDPVAHEEFKRISKILTAVGKNDMILEAVFNEYCMLKSDIDRTILMRKKIEADETLTAPEMYKMTLDLDKTINSLKIRRFNIEKENGMTMSAALRSIPKKPEAEGKNALLDALNDD